MAKQEFLLTGTGGQGLILAAIMLAEAGIMAGRNVAQSQSYGPEARGGASRAEVIISSQVIYYPKVQKPDFVLTLSLEAYRKYGLNLREDAVLIVDCTQITEVKPRRINFYALPITKTTCTQFGSEQSANVVALGVVTSLSRIIPLENVLQAVICRSPRGTTELNAKALKLGWQMGTEAKSKQEALHCKTKVRSAGGINDNESRLD